MFIIKDYYAILEVEPEATFDQIRRAYRRRAMQCHPDRGGSHDAMVSLCEAAEVLLDPEKRLIFDRYRSGVGDAATRDAWENVEHDAQVAADAYPRAWDDFHQWLQTATDDVQRSRWGRAASGLVVGVIGGGLLGMFVGSQFGIGQQAGAMVGVIAGAIGGIIAGATSQPDT